MTKINARETAARQDAEAVAHSMALEGQALPDGWVDEQVRRLAPDVIVTFECHVPAGDAAKIGTPAEVARWIGDLLNDYGIGYRQIRGDAR